MKKECILYKKLKGDLLQCTCCSHYCVIKNWETWKCWIRQNIEWKLFLLTYWQALGVNVDPIEKKPLFHFLPWTKIFSFWTAWCNFTCKFCQNYDMSQIRLKNTPEIEKLWISLPPEKAVQFCLEHGIPSIAFTYNEPTIFFEYAYDVMVLAKEKWIKTVFVSNWFQSKEFWEKSKWLIDAINIDLKWFSEEFYTWICWGRLEPILKNIEYVYKNTDIHIEITTLIIPWENDSDHEIGK
jgi:pyruvate formate lyase activating enzyme